jgi:hypothetical protein
MRLRRAQFGTPTLLACCGLMICGSATPADNPEPAASTATAAVELPPLQAGLWEYHRTVVRSDSTGPQVSTLRRCVDPSSEFRRKMAELRSRNCQFSPLMRKDDSYTSSWTCPTPEGPVRFRNVLIVSDATHYQDMSETRAGSRVIQQKLEARRVSDCPATPAAAAPAPATAAPPKP